MKIKNIAGYTVGWNGLIIEAGSVVDVPDETAAEMIGRNPSRFELVASVSETRVESNQVEDAPDRAQRGARRRST